MPSDTMEEFLADLDRAVEDQLARSAGWLRRDAFARVASDYLIDDGTLEDLEVCYYGAPVGRSRTEVAGYAFSDNGQVLDLAAVGYRFNGQTVPQDQLQRQFKWATTFAAQCREGLHLSLEESSAAFDMAQMINARWAGLRKIRIFLLTDGRTAITSVPAQQLGDLPVELSLWDAERLRRLATSGRLEEAITIDLASLGEELRCLPGPNADAECQCVFTVLPGQLLADIYDRYGAKLLQRNVRAFLQLRGKVNKGIIDTIRNAPDRFLAYNNGISATVTSIVLDERADGTYLAKLGDLQIVNGGQTTATLHQAAFREGADLGRVQVPAKITVVSAEQLDELVPQISRYANSQNSIAEADFESNSPFHVELERFSRTIWAPAAAGDTRQTRWYYERVRGQYQVERARHLTPARQRTFDEQHPKSQKFTKTDAAKYDMSVRQMPHIVSLGAQKCFQFWTMDVLTARTYPPSEIYFQNLVAKAILFDGVRKIIQRLNPGAGYLANVTTYTVALIAAGTNVDALLGDIWRSQRLPVHVVESVHRLSPLVRTVLLRAPGSGNVTEWSKKEECWRRVSSVA